ncbi:ClpP/crotonase-like domain-containing protein [Pelagophyceae sp. CCMP2097]|nr:ClpP/crotonase-like domain-containing protein [Pelagophyceae sp. CCMP2097]
MNNPKKLNGWTRAMRASFEKRFADAARDDATKVVILTAAEPYYSAGVDFAGILVPAMPKVLWTSIYDSNRTLFELFLDFPKPIIAAVNGPAIGATVTTATLCDAIVASDKATFSTPFARVGVPPEGCSSVHFEYLMRDRATAERMLGAEGWSPTAAEAAAIGLVTKTVPHETLLAEANALAESWVATRDLAKRTHMGATDTAAYRRVNDAESKALATAILSADFLDKQQKFFASKGKTSTSLVFRALKATRPAWALLL